MNRRFSLLIELTATLITPAAFATPCTERIATDWTNYWISAHFLVAAAQLDEMGVDWINW